MQPPELRVVPCPRGRDLPPPPPRPKLIRSLGGAGPASFWMPVGLGILGSMFGVVAVGGVSVLSFERGDGARPVAVTGSGRLDPSGVASSANNLEAHAAPPAVAVKDVADATAKTDRDSSAAQQPAQPSEASAKSETAAANNNNNIVPKEPAAPTNVVDNADLATAPARAAARPLDDVRQRKNILPISGEGIGENQLVLCRLAGVTVKDLQLELVHHEFDDPDGMVLELARREQDEIAVWDVTQRATKGLARPEKPGSFTLTNGELRFRWNSGTTPNYLPFCMLRVSVRGTSELDSELCRLWKPVVVREVRINFAKPTSIVDVLPPKTPLPPADSLRLEVDVEKWPEHDFPDGRTLSSGKPATLVLMDPNVAGQVLFTTHLEFRTERGVAQLNATTRAKRVRVSPASGEIKHKDELFATTDLAKIKADGELATKSVEQAMERKVEPSIEQAERNVVRLRNTPQRGLLVKAEKHLEEVLKQREQHEEALKALTELQEWADSVESACRAIETNGRLRLRLFRTTRDGTSIDILITQAASE